VSDDTPIGRQASISDLLPAKDRKDGVCVEGVVDRIVYENDESGFFVARLKESGTGRLTTFVGNLLAVSPGETVRLWGQWVEDRRFGRQLRVARYETVLPNTIEAIERYLGSGLIEGIGPVFAKRLVKAFGVETLRVIDEEPERLRHVEGIGRKRAGLIREAWASQKAIQSIMLFLQGHGIATAQAVKIYKQYGDAAVAVLRDNPYRLADDIAGVAFKSADKIASQLGIPKDAPQRLESGLLYVLQEASSGEGHVFLPESALRERAGQLLEIDADALVAPVQSLAKAQRVVQEDDGAYIPSLHAAETGCARLTQRLLSAPAQLVPIRVEKAIEWVERTRGVELSEEQRSAIRTAVDAKAMVITGGPGTGKTTVLDGLLDIFGKKGLTILLAAPTGRAAKRMEEATGREARTLHRLLEFSPKTGQFTRDEANPLSADLVVVDEASMVDIQLMHSLLCAMPPQGRLFLVGDVDQLPSVGPGNVLMDFVACGAVPVVWLKKVFRQAAKSGIVANAHRINRGEFPEFNDTDFFFIQRPDPTEALATVLEVVGNRLPGKFDLDPFRDIQVLAPMHRGDVGVSTLNEALQRVLNPGAQPIGRRGFGLGDKVMQLRNNYELDVYNGDVGVITVVDEEVKEIQVTFDRGRAVIYRFEDLDELTLAYASTVHKAQGSEYPAVVMPIMPQHYVMLQRNVFYTAVTRAKQLVVVVGVSRAVGRAVSNTRVTQRYTRLAERLRTDQPSPQN